MDDARGDVRQIQSALDRKRGILRHHVNALLQQKRAIALEFIPHSGLVRPPAEIALERAFEALEQSRCVRDFPRVSRNLRIFFNYSGGWVGHF